MRLIGIVTLGTFVLVTMCAESKSVNPLPEAEPKSVKPLPEVEPKPVKPLPEAEPSKCEVSDLTNAMNAFTFDLQRRISKDGNTVFSPYSIYSALAMLSLGADKGSKKQIESAMKWKRGEHMLSSIKTLRKGFTSANSNHDAKLNVAINGWLGEDFKILESFQNETKKYFGINFQRENFRRPETARNRINEWVGNHTGKRINELFPSGSFNSMTKLVLANAMYFKGQWTYPFKKRYTSLRPFYTENSDQPRNVQFMFQSADLLRGNHRNVLLLELPYGKKEEFSMLFAKPRHPSDVWNYEYNPLNFINITHLTDELNEPLMKEFMQSLHRGREVDIHVPRFTMKKGLNLKEKLEELGINDVFVEGKADLSRITGENNLYVSSAEHKAFIEVDEEGTKAAAATGFGISLTSMPPQIKLNRPFLFFILHKPCNSVIFAGRVVDPGA